MRLKSSWPTRGIIDGGSDTNSLGTSTNPKAAAIPVTAIMPISNAPFTFHAVSTLIMNSPKSESIIFVFPLRCPNPISVASFFTIIPAD